MINVRLQNMAMALRLFYRSGFSKTISFRNNRFVRRTNCFHSYLKGEKVAVRLANAGDFDEVLKLSKKMEDTFDYVPYRFHKWLTEPNRINIVAEKGSKVVGFMGMSVVDCDESVVIEGGRVDPNHRNKGIIALIMSLGFELTRQKFPKVVRTRYTVWSGAYQGVQNTIQKHKLSDKELHNYDFLTYKVDPEQINFSNFEHKLENCSSLRPCPKEEFQKNVLKNTGTRSLLPNNILVIDWQPFEAMPSNIEHIAQDRDQYFVDSSNGCQGQLNPSSFSLGRFVQLVRGMVWSSTIYARDSRLCRSQVIHQLTSACQTAQGSFLFSTYQDPSLTKYCKEALSDIPGVTRINDEEPTQKMFIFEGKLEPKTIIQ